MGVDVGVVVGVDVGVEVGVGVAVGVVGVHEPSETFRPVLAPAVWLTMAGTQLAPSSV